MSIINKNKFFEKSTKLADIEEQQEKDYTEKIRRTIDKIVDLLIEEELTFNDWGVISNILFKELGSSANKISIKELKNKNL